LQFSFLFAFRKNKQKKTCSATTAKELFSQRAYLNYGFQPINHTGNPINRTVKHILFFAQCFPIAIKTKRALPLPACRANKE